MTPLYEGFWIIISLLPLGLSIRGLLTGRLMVLRSSHVYVRSQRPGWFWAQLAVYALMVGFCWYQAAHDLFVL